MLGAKIGRSRVELARHPFTAHVGYGICGSARCWCRACICRYVPLRKQQRKDRNRDNTYTKKRFHSQGLRSWIRGASLHPIRKLNSWRLTRSIAIISNGTVDLLIRLNKRLFAAASVLLMLSRRSTVAYVNAVGAEALERDGRAACRSVVGVAFEGPYAVPAQTVSKALDTDTESGLTTAEARRRLSLVGRNELTATPPVAPWRRFIAQFASPLVMLLIAATLISFVVWAIEGETAIPYEALTIMVIVMANAGLGYFQEARAEAAIAGLQKMTSAQATVLRDSVRVIVPVAEIVPGDVLIVGEGAIVPADARVIHSVSLRTMEAALTGESEPVSKDVAPVAADAATADRSNMLFAGTAVAFGHGRAVVTATGMRAEIGRIAGLLAQTVDEKTPLQAELDRTGRILGVIVIAIALVVGATLLLMQQDFSLTVLTTVLLFTIALAVAAVPEGLSAITTVVLSLGMQRMARRNVIVRRLSAVETLGAATVICTDKTGTLTKNEMTVRALVTAGGRVDFSGSGYDARGEVLASGQPVADPAHTHEIERALSAGFVSNNAELVELDGQPVVIGDPTEGALKVAAVKAGLSPERMYACFVRVGEIPFSSQRKLMSTAHADGADGVHDALRQRCSGRIVGTLPRGAGW